LGESQLAEIQRIAEKFLGDREQPEAVDRRTLMKRVKDGNVIVLDVRPRKEYEAGHLAGAISIPVSELKRRLKSLTRTRDIIAYCRGPYCLMASEAVDLLKAKGFRATRLDLGVPEWRELGFDIEIGGEEVHP
jgi:rhodanese-related sulfurtransferase